MSKTQKVIVLTNYSLWYYEVNGSHASRKLRQELPVDDLHKMDQFFAEKTPPQVKIILNIYEEEFVFSNIPHVNRFDRNRIVKRKLEQQFKSSELRKYFFQDRKLDGRQDDVVMLSAVRNAEYLDQLLDYLFSRKVPIEGIYSTITLMRLYLKPIIANRDVLVMTEIDNGSTQRVAVRQSFYKDGHLKLSRVANIYVANEKTLRDDIQEELESSRLYLIREKYIRDDDKLNVVFIHSTDYLSDLSRRPSCMGDCFLLEHVSTEGLSEMLGATVDAEKIKYEDVSAVGAMQLHGGSYSSEKTRYYQKHNKLRGYFRWASVAAVLGFTALSLQLIFVTHSIGNGYEERLNATNRLHASVLERKQTINTLEEDIDQIQIAVDLVDNVEAGNVDAHNLFVSIGSAFSRYPRLSIVELDWRGREADDQSADRSASDADEYDEDDSNDGYDDSGLDDDSELVVPKSETQIVSLRAMPSQYGSNVRQMMRDIESLVAELKSDNHIVEVKVVKYPLNLDQDQMLRGRFADSEYQSFSADSSFDMELIYDQAAG